MNDGRVHDNWIFDNWRNGAMLFAVPDAFVTGGGAEGDIFPGISCPGAPANGSRPRAATGSTTTTWARRRTGSSSRTRSTCSATCTPTTTRGRKKPNGNDFWWDEFFASNTGNCWFDNTGTDGTAASVTGPGEAGRLPADPPQVLPSDCAIERRQPRRRRKLNYLVECGNGPDDDTGPTDCDWWTTPPQPGSAAAAEAQLAERPRRAPVREVSRGRGTAANGSPSLLRPDAEAGRDSAARPWRCSLALVAFTGCGDSGEPDEAARAEAEGVGPVVAGSTAQFANCWRLAPRDRGGALRDDRGHQRPAHPADAPKQRSPTSPTRPPIGCSRRSARTDYSDSMRLYKLYARAQAFAPLDPDVGG